MNDGSQRLGTVLCLGSAVAFGAMAILGKLAYEEGVSVLTLLWVRFTLAATALWLIVATRSSLPRTGRRTLLGAFALGAVGYALQSGLFFAALERMDASLLALILYTYPALTTAGAILLGREKPSRRRAGALLLSSGGLVLMLAGAGEGGIDLLATIMGFAAALTYTIYILVSHSITSRIGPITLSAIVTTGAALTFGAVGAASGSIDTGFEPAGWLWLGLIALVSTVGAIVLFFAGLQRVGPSGAAILSSFEPLMTVGLAFVVFGEALRPLQFLGGALVLSAVVVLHIRPPQAQPA